MVRHGLEGVPRGLIDELHSIEARDPARNHVLDEESQVFDLYREVVEKEKIKRIFYEETERARR